jgi:hypothetical protein
LTFGAFIEKISRKLNLDFNLPEVASLIVKGILFYGLGGQKNTLNPLLHANYDPFL